MPLTHEDFKAAVELLKEGDFSGTTPKIGPLNRVLRNSGFEPITAAQRDALLEGESPEWGEEQDDAPEAEEDGPVECIVMSKTNITLDCQRTEKNPEGKTPFRARVMVPRDEFDRICRLDKAAGRDLRLMEI